MKHFSIRSQNQYAVLPPSRAAVSSAFQNVEYDANRHSQLMAEMQRFRGGIYAADGAIRADQLTPDGRHKVAIDDRSWHVLSLNERGQVCGCLRYLEEGGARDFDDLGIRHSALTRSPNLGHKFRAAVETEMARSRQLRIGFGEVGGWAVAEECRLRLEPLRIILATFGLLELLGGCAGVATATSRHHSSTILRKIGLSSLQADGEDLPPYYDPQYSCEMEVLRFDSRYPNPKYKEWVDDLAFSLSAAPVISDARPRCMNPAFRSFEAVPSQSAMVAVA
jgi:hypothetical protein